jgi:hypothetical protein
VGNCRIEVDKLLDTVAVTTSADGARNAANVQLMMKLATNPEDPSAQMPSINLTSTSTASEAAADRAKIGTISSTH